MNRKYIIKNKMIAITLAVLMMTSLVNIYSDARVAAEDLATEFTDESGRYKDPEIQMPNVIVSELQESAVRFGEFIPNKWEYATELSDEFDESTLSDLWHPYYMDWWPIQEKQGVGGSIPKYELKDGYLRLIGEPSQPYWWDQDVRKHGDYKVIGIMGGAKDYLNLGPSIDGVPIQKHVPYMDKGATTYGFFEARARSTVGKDVIPAIWSIGFEDKGGNIQNGELDWPEMFNEESYPHRRNKLTIRHHAKGNAYTFPELPQDIDISMYLDEGEDYRGDWHTYGLEWGPGFVRYFFDGHLIGEYKAYIDYRMIPILSLNYRPDLQENPWTQHFDIDYFRVWKNIDVIDPYEEAVLPEAGNIAAYAHMSMFGQTSAQYNATPSQLLNDGNLSNMVYSGLQQNSAYSNTSVNLPHTPLPAYIYSDFRGPVEYNSLILYSILAKSQAPTLIDIEISEDGQTNWTPVKQGIELNWQTNTIIPEGLKIDLDHTVTNNKHMRIVVQEANFNLAKKFGLSEIEIGLDLTPPNITLPSMPAKQEPPSEVTLPGKFAHWDFEGTSAEFYKDKIRQNAALGSKLPEIGQNSEIASGMQAAIFNGTNNEITLPMGGFNITQNLTASVWFKIDGVPAAASYILLQQLGSGQMFLNVIPNNGKYNLSSFFGNSLLTGKKDISIGEWHQATLVFNKPEKKVKIYLDGQLDVERSYNGYGTNFNTNFRLGSNKDATGNYFYGSMDEVAFFQHALSSEQIAWYYHSILPSQEGIYQINNVLPNPSIVIDKGGEVEGVLPSHAMVHLNGTYQHELEVEWDLTAVNTEIVGKKILQGILVLPADDSRISNPNNLVASVTIEIVDKEILRDEIEAAKNLLDHSLDKDYPNGAKDELQSAIDIASQINDHEQSNQAQINIAVDSLRQAVDIFKSGKIEGEIKGDLTIGTFNIAAMLKPDVNKLRQLTEDYNLDIVGLQEVDIRTSRNNYDMLDTFAGTTYPHTYFSKAINYGGGAYGIATVSKYPIVEESTVFVDTTGATEARVYQRVLIEKEGKEIAVYNTHLSWETRQIRESQFAQLKLAVDEDDAEYKVILGDFNADQDTSEFHYFLDNYNMANGKNGVWFNTFNRMDNTMNNYAIDNIMTSRNMNVTHIEVVETALSDHHLLYIVLEFLDEAVPSRELLDIRLSEGKNLHAEDYTRASYEALQDEIAMIEASVEQSNLTQVEINGFIVRLEAAISQLESGNKLLLERKIGEAQSRLIETEKGNGLGEFPEAARATLEVAILLAESTLNNNETTTDEVVAALSALSDAIAIYDAAEIRELALPDTPTAGDVMITQPASGAATGQTMITIDPALEFRITNASKVEKQGWTTGTGVVQTTSASPNLVAGDQIEVRVKSSGSTPASGIYIQTVAAEHIGIASSRPPVYIPATKSPEADLPDKEVIDLDPEEVPKGSGVPEVSEEVPSVTFTDIAGHWGAASIAKAVKQGFIGGYPDGTFKPNRSVTRAEFATMLVRALNLQGDGMSLDSFTDKQQIDAWARIAISKALEAGIINGYADGTFRPNAKITRAEMVLMIIRALDVALNNEASTQFIDASDIPEWALGAVGAAFELEIVKGRGHNLFVPNATATRAEAVEMLLNMLSIEK